MSSRKKAGSWDFRLSAMTLSGSADRQKTEVGLQLLEVSKISFFDHLFLYSLIHIIECLFVNPPMKENPSYTRLYRGSASLLSRNYIGCCKYEPRQNLPGRSSRWPLNAISRSDKSIRIMQESRSIRSCFLLLLKYVKAYLSLVLLPCLVQTLMRPLWLKTGYHF